MQDSLPAGGLRLYREGVEPSGSLRKVSGYISILLSRTCPVARVGNDESAHYEKKLNAKVAGRKQVYQCVVRGSRQMPVFCNSDRTLTKMLKNNWKDRQKS